MDSKKIWIIVGIVTTVLCLCACAALIAAGILGFNFLREQTGGSANLVEQAVTPIFPATPTSGLPTVTPVIKSNNTPLAAVNGAQETYQTIKNAVVPVNDLIELAQRLGGMTNIPTTVIDPGAPYQIGDHKKFWAMNQDTTEQFQVDTVLRAVSDVAYFWIEDGVSYNQEDLDLLMADFSENIVPTNREIFGNEWSPGIDNDPHLFIVYARNLGSIAGVFSSGDSYPPQVRKYSNAHEIFFLSADSTGLDQNFTYGVLAHEFQHMIHWYRDRNESVWVNEGFSELAAFLNGFDLGGFDYVFSLDPDIQLNDWPPNQNETTIPHYGASFLFMSYFLDRFGKEATQALIANPEDGMDGVDSVLAGMDAVEPQTGQPLRADDLFSDWVLANYIQDPSVGDGRYAYRDYRSAPQVAETEQITDCSGFWQNRQVHQYAADYIRFKCGGDFTLKLDGAGEVGVLAEGAHSGEYAFWSNKGDESDMTLSRQFDFSTVSGPLTFTYWTWFDLEKDYDFLYLLASEDGQTWQILNTPSCQTYDPSGNSYGCGYNGLIAQYIQEKVDLSAFAGKKIWLRFELVTDEAVNSEGFLVDDVAVPEIGYSNDFEKDDGGWQANGFVRIQNRLPQTYRLALITYSAWQTSVQTLTFDANQSLNLPITLNDPQDEVVLVVSGTTRYTRQPAAYRFNAMR